MARSAGFGSIRKLPSKRWQARYYGPDTRYHSGPHTFQTKADAQGWLVRERQLITDGSWAPPAVRAQRAADAEQQRRERTLAVYAEGWLASRVTSKGAALRASTREGYRNALNNHVLPTFGELPIDEITTAAVRHWRGQYAAAGRDATGAKAYGLLKAILQTAEDDELVPRNPCRLKGAGQVDKKHQSTALTPTELHALAQAMPPQWRALTLMSGWCGLRIGEAAGLRRCDVDLDAGTLHVVQTAQYIGSPSQLVIGPPKTARGTRTVHMPDQVIEAIRDHLAARPGLRSQDLVWTRRDGQAISRHTLLKSFKTAAASIGRPGMVWHDLRHTANTLAADAGATQATLQARMGHADPKVSAIYLHTSQNHDRNLAAALTAMGAQGRVADAADE